MAVDRCAACGFDPALLDSADVAADIARWTRECAGVVAAAPSDAALRARSAGLAWSPIEYVGHLRDVMALFTERVRLILAAEGPELPVVDHDDAVRRGDYRRLDPREAVADLVASADALRAVLAGIDRDAWDRVGYRAGEERSVGEIALRAAHEARHHTQDIARGLADSR